MNEQTATEWRDCADPDELAAAVADAVEVQRMRGPVRVPSALTQWVPSALTHRDDFAWRLTHGTRYQLPTWWTWRPEPPAPDDLAARARRHADTHPESRDLIEELLGTGWVALTEYVPGDVVADLDGGRQVCTAPTPPPVPPNPMAVREFAAKVADYVSTHQNADGMSKRGWAIEAVVQALEEPTASQEARSILAPTPPWPGAVLSGLVDEDGEPTWLAQAGQVRGEQVRGWRDMAWYRPHGHSSDTWVEVRAPRAVPAAPVTVTIPAETAHALLRYIEDGDYDTDYVIDRLADLLIAAMDGDQ